MDAHGRILVVEDDAVIQRLIGTMLDGVGYSVVFAVDGEAGLEAFNSSGFDLIITDNNMPKVSGVEMIRRLRETHPHLPVILISGEIPRHLQDLTALLTPGIALEKPFSMAQLLGHVRAQLVAAGLPAHSAA
jgi:DNA-binding response OmpR family regulator